MGTLDLACTSLAPGMGLAAPYAEPSPFPHLHPFFPPLWVPSSLLTPHSLNCFFVASPALEHSIHLPLPLLPLKSLQQWLVSLYCHSPRGGDSSLQESLRQPQAVEDFRELAV